MKKKIVAILVCMLVAICSTFTAMASTSVEKQISVTQNNKSKQAITTLIAESNGNRVIEVDSSGTIVWQKTGLKFPFDAERLANGNTLIAENDVYYPGRVIEVDSGGTIVWQKAGMNWPIDAERLLNGNTLIVEFYNNRVIEVDTSGTIVWQKTGMNWPTDAERLLNGNTLISEFYKNRVIEVDSSGTIVWEKAGVNFPFDAERLVNGNTLITEYYITNRVIEVDSSGTIVWQKGGLNSPVDAERLRNGNTLITEYGNRVIEVDIGGTIVWQKTGLDDSFDAERISNEPPSAPTITGQTNGKPGHEYEYTFNATDPDGDDVRYIIDWGDNTSNMTDFNPSVTNVMVKHTWSEDGTYNITAKAQDIYGAEGSEGTLTVTIPRNKHFSFNFNMLGWLFGRFPIFEVFLRAINLLR